MILHCFSAPDRLEECVERGYLCSFAGNVTYPKATELQEAARRVPDELLLVETDAPYLAPQPLRGKPNEPANVIHTARWVAELRGVAYEDARAHGRGERRAGVRLVSEPRQASLRRLRRFDVAPEPRARPELPDRRQPARRDRARRRARRRPTWCSRWAAGSACSREYLAPRVAHLHVVEVDRSLEPALADALAPFANATLHLADAVKLDLGALGRAPTKVVANLPYGVAATVLLKSIAELPDAEPVGGDGPARGGRAARGRARRPRRTARPPCSPSSRARSRVLRKVPRTVFHPAPNVDSALVSLRRRGPAPDDAVRDLVHAGFAHRRKALAGSLALAPGVARRASATRCAPRSSRWSLPPDARAERLRPEHWTRLADALGGAEPRRVACRPWSASSPPRS